MTRCSTFQRGLFLLITILLLDGTIAAQDRKTQEEAAGRLMEDSFQLVVEGSPTSLRKALDKIESARISLHSLNLPEGEAVMLMLAGAVYHLLEQNEKAIEKYEQSLLSFVLLVSEGARPSHY